MTTKLQILTRKRNFAKNDAYGNNCSFGKIGKS